MRLHSSTVGTGELQVGLVHGLGADETIWQPVIERLLATGRYTVTALDLRGHGLSDRSTSYRLGEFADDVVETLPPKMHCVVGHSLGGSVLVRAVERLQPAHAIYLDPGFGLALPTSGLAGRAFWAVPVLTLGVVGALQARRGAAQRAAYGPAIQASMKRGREKFDAKMAMGVFREVAFSPVQIAPPTVPSTIVLSDESPAVVPDAMVAGLEREGWEIERIAGVHHDMHIEDPGRIASVIEQLDR